VSDRSLCLVTVENFKPEESEESIGPWYWSIAGRTLSQSEIGAEGRCYASLYNDDHLSGEISPPVPTLREIEDRVSVQPRLAALAIFTCLLLAMSGCRGSIARAPEAKISFSQVPQWDLGDQNQADVIEGSVSGARQGEHLVLYSKTGNLWWLQPRVTSPFTLILPDGVWRNEVHLATDYAALLVDSTYNPLPVVADLPKPGHGIEAVASSRGQERSSSFFVNFSGFQWRVRKVASDRGGTRNPYDPNNVYVDQAGALHLQILDRNQQWTCSEVNLTRSLGYGTYSFTVEDTSHFEPAAVFAIFTWDYSSNQGNRGEFDINISRWADPQNKNAEFVIQPAFVPLNMTRFVAPPGKLKHTFVWAAGRITMITSRVLSNGSTDLVSKHIFTSEIPTPGSESVRMTFYIYSDPNHKLPGVHHSAEVVVDRFEYMP